MLIYWKGWGLLAPLIIMSVTLIFYFVTTAIFTNHYYVENVAMPLGAALSSIPCWYVGCYLNNKPGREVIDTETGKKVTLEPEEHSFLMLKVQYWAFGALLLAFMLMFN